MAGTDSVKSLMFFGLHLYLMSLLIMYVCFYTPLTRGYDRAQFI